MITLTNAAHPLDFAYLAAKRLYFPWSQVTALTGVAVRFGRKGGDIEVRKSLAILDEARLCQLQLREECGPLRFLDFTDLARSYEAIQRHDLALGILDESVGFAASCNAFNRVQLLVETAVTAFAIGEPDFCRSCLDKIQKVVHKRTRLRGSHGWVEPLVTLYLQLGMREEASLLCERLSPLERGAALGRLAFYGQERGGCDEQLLARALRGPCWLDLVDLLAGNGQFERALLLAKEITEKSSWCEVHAGVACRLFEAGETAGALEIVKLVSDCCRKENPWFDEGHLLGLLVPLRAAGHGDSATSLLDHAIAKTHRLEDEKDRYGQLAGLLPHVAALDRDRAESIADELLAAPLERFDPLVDDPGVFFNRTAPCILLRVAEEIDDGDLLWTAARKERFVGILKQLPAYARP